MVGVNVFLFNEIFRIDFVNFVGYELFVGFFFFDLMKCDSIVILFINGCNWVFFECCFYVIC